MPANWKFYPDKVLGSFPHRFGRGDSIHDGDDSRESLAVTVAEALPLYI